jgi:hypothetical protein
MYDWIVGFLVNQSNAFIKIEFAASVGFFSSCGETSNGANFMSHGIVLSCHLNALPSPPQNQNS